ncbi:MAG: serine/threonine-protein kinase [Verrucomicrobiota bacterium]
MSDERYEIRGKIGQGGVGAVYRAFDRNLNREVAIKRVLTEEGFDAQNSEDEAVKSLLKEATALSSVQHPHIVTVYDAGVDEDGPYVVMELLSGRTIDEMVERGTMTWLDFREVAYQTQEALIAAQELDIVHRDIKPTNVMVTWLPSGKFQVKLVDFGLAKFSAKPSLQTIDHADAVFGSIHFMAPEQFERVPLDKRTDMYSLGCVYYFCLTGGFPFDGETAPQVMASHLNNTYTPLKELRPDIPDWACQWVEWHLERQPDDRPKDARESFERFRSFDQPNEPVVSHVKAVPAASLLSQAGIPKTGPVPEHVVAASPSAPVEVKAEVPRVKLNTGPVVPSAETSAVKLVAPTAPVAEVVAAPVEPVVAAGPAGSTGVGGGIPEPPTERAVAIPQTGMRSTAAKATIATLLGMAVIIVGVLFVNHLGKRKETQMIQSLIDQAADATVTSIPMDGEEVDLLLGVVRSPGFDKDKDAVFQTLTVGEATDGTDIDRRVAEFAARETLPEEVRVKLFRVLDYRKGPTAMPVLVRFLEEASEERALVAAVSAARHHLNDMDIAVIFNLISFSESDEVRGAAERAVRGYAQAQRSTSQLSRDLAKAYEAAKNPTAQKVYLRLLGVTGGSVAEEAVKSALESEDETVVVSAYTALQNWPDDSMFELHFERMKGERKTFLRTQAFDSVLGYLVQSEEIPPKKAVDLWKDLAGEAGNDREKKELITALARRGQKWAVPIVQGFLEGESDDISFLAERALESLSKK